jgi:hypothetical protein
LIFKQNCLSQTDIFFLFQFYINSIMKITISVLRLTEMELVFMLKMCTEFLMKMMTQLIALKDKWKHLNINLIDTDIPLSRDFWIKFYANNVCLVMIHNYPLFLNILLHLFNNFKMNNLVLKRLLRIYLIWMMLMLKHEKVYNRGCKYGKTPFLIKIEVNGLLNTS